MSEPSLAHCTLSENGAAHFGGRISSYDDAAPRLTDCILWGDTLDEIYRYSGSPSLSYCDVQGGYAVQGKIDANPKFSSYAGYDYVLRPGSPCIDAGTGEDDGVDWGSIHSRYGDFNTSLPDLGAYGGPGATEWLP